MRKTLKEIAVLINGEVVGDDNIVVTGIAGIQEALPGDITFLANPKYLTFIDRTKASAVITSRDIKSARCAIIRVENPSLAFTKVVSWVTPQESHPEGLHSTVIRGKKVILGKDVALAAYVVIEDSVSIGDKTVVYPGCYIGANVKIGRNSIIYPNVSIREESIIGSNVIIHSGTVIGSDGFGFVTVDGIHHKIPQLGKVVIEDDVEIGSNVSIDRARFDKTVIGKGTKIDNLVHIAHNVIIGKNCLIVAQVGISGSTTLGNNVVLAGQVGVVGHVNIGDNSIVMAQSGVSKSLPADSIVWGYPAKPADTAKRTNACVQNLPRLYDTVSELKKKIEKSDK